jgi:hypothetical protein
MADDEKTKVPLGRRIARNGIRVIAGLAIGLVIAEVAFHYRDGGAFPHLNIYIYVVDADRGVRLQPGATERISFSNSPITSVRINGEGYRGPEMVVVGDSQELALAWNAWQPTDEIAVDIGGLETDGGTIVWQRCSDGPCVLDRH